MPQDKRRVIVVGSADMELYMNVSRMPGQGESVLDAGGVAYMPGGMGLGSAVALAKLGEHPVLCAKLGADIHGQKLYNYCKDMGVDSSFLKVDCEHQTGLSVIISEGEGAPREIIYPGANSYITAESLSEAFECEPDGLLLGFDLPFSTVLTAAKLASAKNIPIFVDASPADKMLELESLPAVDVVMLNEAQMAEYTGVAPGTMETSLRACLSLCRRIKCKCVVIKLGARGAFVYDGKRYYSIPAIRADKTVDESGAGCAFGAALVSEYLYSGGDLKSAVTYGCAAGAVAVTRVGASSSAPSSEELEALLSRM